jgi:hypothetical protein
MKYRILQIMPPSFVLGSADYVLFKNEVTNPELIDRLKESKQQGGDWEEFSNQNWAHVIQSRPVVCWALIEQGKGTSVLPLVPDLETGELRPAEEIEGYLGLAGYGSNAASALAIDILKELLK